MLEVILRQTLVESFNTIPDAVLDKIVKMFHRVGCPLMLGAISADVSWSLERTEMMLDSLIEKGIVRRATRQELEVLGLSVAANVYVLIGTASLSRAGL